MSLIAQPATFSVNFDYRCPFARNANEHVLAGLEAGAPWVVTFLSFSLSQTHVEDGEAPVWDQPAKRPELTAVAAGIVVRDRFPAHFRDVHLELFRARHDEGGDLRSDEVIRAALERGGVDPDAVYAELADGWPFETFRKEHEASVAEHSAFGVPTFVIGDEAAFVRVMTRPEGDAELAGRTIGRIIELLTGAPELNEFKHTTVSR
ncbi:MAG: hypothetical protein JWO62_2973 [Acidimicrobiaceae bacterium]|jgi:hypothetical protein|nr:hypothetical protein [Acidimicrobiaceae bacterium]